MGSVQGKQPYIGISETSGGVDLEPIPWYNIKIMVVTVNGRQQECAPGCTLAQLIAALRLESAAVVAEVAGRIVPPADYAETILREHDHLELVRFVGGG